MNLHDFIMRTSPPLPWAEGDNIPWNDPEFSARMLKEHLSQAHDAASRRTEKIEMQVDWIHQHLLAGQPTRILDLACGPGLYASRFARRGHTCRGIDFSPASIAYAQAQLELEPLACSYEHQDIREAEYGKGFGLAMLIFGELNIFKPADARRILTKAHDALADGGLILLEPHTFQFVRQMGDQESSWYSSKGGLFMPHPHLVLHEYFWDEPTRTVAMRYWIVDARTGEVSRYAQTFQPYTDDEYAALLISCGFRNVKFYPSLIGTDDPTQHALFALTARK